MYAHSEMARQLSQERLDSVQRNHAARQVSVRNRARRRMARAERRMSRAWVQASRLRQELEAEF